MAQIVPLIYDWIKSQPNKHYTHISPSSLGYCHRAHFYKIMGIEPTTPPNPGALLNFELGRLWETPIEKALSSHGVPFISQFRIEDDELGVAGSPDVVLVHPDGLQLVSIKTEGKDKDKWRKIKNESFFESNPEYQVQEMTYKILLERKGYKVYDTALYIVITKDNGLLSEPTLLFTDELAEYTMNRIHTLRKALNDGLPPACECEGWKTGFCNFGNPETRVKNKTGKLVNSECCSLGLWQERLV